MTDKRTDKATGRPAAKSRKPSTGTTGKTTTVPQEIRRNIYVPDRERGLHSSVLNSSR
jgi:hypothetical protein